MSLLLNDNQPNILNDDRFVQRPGPILPSIIALHIALALSLFIISSHMVLIAFGSFIISSHIIFISVGSFSHVPAKLPQGLFITCRRRHLALALRASAKRQQGNFFIYECQFM